jgi:hypothetical protein
VGRVCCRRANSSQFALPFEDLIGFVQSLIESNNVADADAPLAW